MTPQDYAYLSKLLNERSGLHLAGDKQYLIESRLLPVARQNNCGSIGDLVAKLKQFAEEPLRQRVTEAMTINESFFFRDKTPFERFQDTVLPQMQKLRAATKRIRIWCAAASTGQEPYSLAMMFKQVEQEFAGWKIEIVATDISADVLEKAKAGLYTQFEVQRGLPIQLLLKYFKQDGDQWRIAQELRDMVQYRQHNLLDDFAMLGMFDVIFCRNVLIYFDSKTKQDVLTRIARSLVRDGHLLLGAAETVVGFTNLFMPMPDKRGLYVHSVEKKPEPKPAFAMRA
ncbi:MAG: protein-glutamate O-methyltransferase CheR [Xanthobacteraceae bacterium]|nr:protein-glutamate O-methyltransferase CheR [Xanthobacteraceae bacterium]